jgi:hypothetical protein
VINDNKMRRPLLAAGAALLALVAGCGSDSGPSAGASTEDTTETSSSSKPEIDDPAVEAAALRTVDPCALLTDANLGDTGTVAPDSSSTSEWGECSVDVTDANGKTVEFVLRVGDQIILVDDPTEELEGLPLVVDDEDPESCWVSVVTSYELSLAVTFQVDYVGGDGCAAGKAALTKVVQALHNNPPQYQQLPGSVLTADPCAVADKEAIETALGQKSFMEPKSVHECDFWSGDGTNYPLVSIRFFQGLPPDAGDGKPVDLGGVSAIQAEEEDSVVSCDVSWRKIETPSEDEAEGYGELVSVQFRGEPGDLDTTTACEKAVAVAKTVAPSLA